MNLSRYPNLDRIYFWVHPRRIGRLGFAITKAWGIGRNQCGPFAKTLQIGPIRLYWWAE